MYDIIIDDEISVWGYGSQKHRENLSKLDGNIKIFMSSYGGDVYEAIDIYNMNREYSKSKGQVEIVVGSKAMSAGAIITMSADRKVAHANSTFMIHRAWTFTWGNAVELMQESQVLNGIDKIQAKDFAKYIGTTEDEMLAILTNDKYYIGKEELESTNIFDEIIENDEVTSTQRKESSSYASAKKSFLAKVEKNEYVPNLASAKKAILSCSDGKCPMDNGGVNHSSLTASAQITNSTQGNSMEYTEKTFQALKDTHAEAIKAMATERDSVAASLVEVNAKLATAEAVVAEYKTLKDKVEAKAKAIPEIMAMAYEKGVDKNTLVAMAQADNLDKAKVALVDGMSSDGAFGASGGEDSQGERKAWANVKKRGKK